MLNKILNVIICVGVPYVVITWAFRNLGTTMGFGVTILCFIALFLYFKPRIYTILGRQKYLSDHDAGFKYMEKAHATGRMHPQDALIYAYMLIRDGHLTKAEKLIAGTIHQDKNKLSEKNLLAADLNSAIILWKKNDLPAAIEKMEGVYNTGYRSTVLYQTLGIFYLMNNDLIKAESFLNEAMDYNGDDISIRDNLGLLYIKQGDFQKAEEIYKKIFEETTPSFIEAHYNYATVLKHKGDIENACKYYQKALGCPERFLSTVKLSLVEAELADAESKLN